MAPAYFGCMRLVLALIGLSILAGCQKDPDVLDPITGARVRRAQARGLLAVLSCPLNNERSSRQEDGWA